MTSYFDEFKKKIDLRGVSRADRLLKLKEREFELFFNESLTKYSDCLLNGVPVEMVFQDQNQSNNKDLSDDKYVLARNEINIGIGDYITWADTDWLVFTEEYKTIRTHKQVKVKRVNETIKWIRNGKIINNEKGYGAYVQSQTLYTMGVQKNNTLHVVDSKMSIYIQANEDTRDLMMGERVIVGRRAYKLNFIDDVSRPGLISFLLDEDTISEYDNIELGVADYGRYYGNTEIERPNIEDSDDTSTAGMEITGNQRVKISATYTYSTVGFVAKGWLIESLLNETPTIVQSKTGENITLVVKDDFRFIGKQFNLVALVNDKDRVVLPITIIKKF